MKEKKIKIWKILLGVIVLIFFLFVIFLTRKMIILSSLENKLAGYQEKNNIYVKTEITDSENNTTFEKYYKDGIEKDVLSIPNREEKITQYLYDNERKLYVEKGDKKTVTTTEKPEEIVASVLVSYTSYENFWQLLFNSITSSITTAQLDGKECYVISSSYNLNFIYEGDSDTVKVYIDKETGLALKCEEVNNNRITKYQYSFDTVQDEDLKEPDMEQYTKENV